MPVSADTHSVCLLCIRSATQDNAAGTVNGAVDHLFLGKGGIHHIAVSRIDRHMADIQVTVVDFKGIEDQVSGGKAVIGYGKVVLSNIPCLCRRRVGAAMLQVYPQLAVYPVGETIREVLSILKAEFE